VYRKTAGALVEAAEMCFRHEASARSGGISATGKSLALHSAAAESLDAGMLGSGRGARSGLFHDFTPQGPET